jgi:hypothetical protein
MAQTIIERMALLSKEAKAIQHRVFNIINERPLVFLEGLQRIVSETMITAVPSTKPKPSAVAARPKPPKKPLSPKMAKRHVAAAEGRRAVARGDRPPLKEAMAIVSGNDKVTSLTVVNRLKDKGWLPNAANPRSYISYMFSSNKDVFENVRRGVYRVVEGWKPSHKGPQLREKLLRSLVGDHFVRGAILAKKVEVPTGEVSRTLKDLEKVGLVSSRSRNTHREWIKASALPN